MNYKNKQLQKKVRFNTISLPVICGLLLLFYSCKDDEENIALPVISKHTITHFNYGGSKNDSFRSVVATADGGYIAAGYTQSINGDITDKTIEEYDYWIVKYTENGIVEWSKTYGGSNDDRASKIIQTEDGGYAVIGYSRSNDLDVITNNGLKDFWMLKLDASGNISWQKTFGFSGDDKGITLLQTTDGGYFLGGTINVTASGGLGIDKSALILHAGSDYWAIKLDASGAKQWRKYYGGGQTDVLNDAIQTPDGGFLLIGDSDSADVNISNNKGSYDFWVVKTAADGSIMWEKSYGGSEIEKGYSIIKTPDSNYLIVGDARSTDGDLTNTNGNADVWVLKINETGGVIWQKTYGGNSFDNARSVINNANNGFFITGSSRSSTNDATTNNGQNDVWILKIDEEGKLDWQKSIGGSEVDFSFSITQLQNGNIIVAGETASNNFDFPNNKGFKDAILIKIN